MNFEAADVADDLRTLGTLLARERICVDVKALEDAAQICASSKKGEWGYDLTDLVLDVGGKGVKCHPSQLTDIQCRLDIKVGGKCIPGATCGDPLFNTMVNMMLKAVDLSSGVSYTQAWHLDRQPDRHGIPYGVHPRYHLNFGGRHLSSVLTGTPGPQFSNLLLLDAPRMAHAPLDGVLAVDFILSNLSGAKWKVLRGDPDYVRVVVRFA